MSWLEPDDAEREAIERARAAAGPDAGDLLALARRLAPALRVEPLLLRNARVRHLPASEPELEVLLWQGPLVGARGPRSITLVPGAARILADELAAGDPEAFADAVAFVREHTRHWPPLARLEQELRLAARARDEAAIRAALERVLASLARAGEGERIEHARWVRSALPAAVPAGAGPPEAGWLARYSASVLGDPGGAFGAWAGPAARFPRWLRDLLPGALRESRLGLRLRERGLECVEPEAAEHAITIPGGLPAPLRVAPEPAADPDAPGRWEPVWPGRVVPLPAGWRRVTLENAAGERWRLETESGGEPDDAFAQAEPPDRVLVAFAPGDDELAASVAKALEANGIRAEPVPEKPGEPPPPAGPGIARIRLWTPLAASLHGDRPPPPADEAAAGPSLVASPLIVRLGDAPLPAVDPALAPPVLDLPDWSGDPASEPAVRMVEALAGLRAGIPDAGGAEAGLLRIGPWRVPAGISAEVRALLDELLSPETPPERRLEIGNQLAEVGDPRIGVDLREDGVPDIDWVEVPGGPFIYQEGETRELPTFWLSRYPVTNAQYEAFVRAGGYEDERWWRGLVQQGFEKPDAPRWSEANRPRESVSWYEAVAYCRWLSDALGYEVRLPLEEEWEKGARGVDGREYPWGDGYRVGHANVDETVRKGGPHYLEETTAVGLYPHGASPYGLLDMSGNVWEWTLDKHNQPVRATQAGRAERVLRGGSWYSDPEHARVTQRTRISPVVRRHYLGFRLLSSPPNLRR